MTEKDKPMDDKLIVDLYWQRSQRAVAESDKKYGRYCHTIAMNICGNTEDSEECVSDTWLSAWNTIPPKRPGILSAFFGAITRNAAISRVRSERREKRGGGQQTLVLEELEDSIPSRDNVENQLEAKDLSDSINRFLKGLKQEERNLFVARYYYMVPQPEIARRLHCSEGKVRTTLYRLRQKLAKKLKEEGLW